MMNASTGLASPVNKISLLAASLANVLVGAARGSLAIKRYEKICYTYL